MKKSVLLLITALSIIGLAFTQAEAAKGYGEAVKTTASLKDTKKLVEVALSELDKTMTPLNRLTTAQGDLRKDYEVFSGELKDLNEVTNDIRAVVTKMYARSDEYFAKWQEQTAALTSEDLKARAAERREATQQQLTKIRTLLDDVKATSTPLLANLQDIDAYLSTDLNAQSVASIKDLIQKANSDAEQVKTKVGAAMAELDNFAATISPKG